MSIEKNKGTITFISSDGTIYSNSSNKSFNKNGIIKTNRSITLINQNGNKIEYISYKNSYIKTDDSGSDNASKGLAYTLNEDGQSYSVTGIGECTDTNVVIPETYEGLLVTNIGSNAFNGCTSLESVRISNNIKNIRSLAFLGCTSLKSIEIPNSVTDIESNAFNGCTSLESIEIPNSVTNIGSNAFNGCTSLESVKISNNIKNIRSAAFCNCTSLKSIKIPDSMFFIERAVFYKCTSLESVVIGSGFSTLSTTMFEECTSLKNILIPNNITRINGKAFYNCTSLIYLTIPDSVTRIESKALQIGSSDNKATIRFEGITPPTISTDTFDISKLDKIEVPMSALDKYKSETNWSNFADYIVGY